MHIILNDDNDVWKAGQSRIEKAQSIKKTFF